MFIVPDARSEVGGGVEGECGQLDDGGDADEAPGGGGGEERVGSRLPRVRGASSRRE